MAAPDRATEYRWRLFVVTIGLADLGEVQRMERTGPSLVRALEGIRARHRLNPIEVDSATSDQDDIIRVVCSDGLV